MPGERCGARTRPAANSSGAQTTELAPNYFSVGPTGGSATRSSTNSSRHFKVWRRFVKRMETGPQQNSLSRFALSSKRQPRLAQMEHAAVRGNSGQPSKRQKRGRLPTRGNRRRPRQITAVRDDLAYVSVDETEPVDVMPNPDRPYFAHLAMCKDQKKDDKTAPIQPPLGWVLSKWTEETFSRSSDELRK